MEEAAAWWNKPVGPVTVLAAPAALLEAAATAGSEHKVDITDVLTLTSKIETFLTFILNQIFSADGTMYKNSEFYFYLFCPWNLSSKGYFTKIFQMTQNFWKILTY